MYRIYLHFALVVPQNQDSVNTDTVCRLYEVGRQRLAEEEEEDDEDQVLSLFILIWIYGHPFYLRRGLEVKCNLP